MWGAVGGLVLGTLLALIVGGMEVCAVDNDPVSTVPFDPSNPDTYDLSDNSECHALVRDVNAAVGIFGGLFGSVLGWFAQAAYVHWDKLRSNE